MIGDPIFNARVAKGRCVMQTPRISRGRQLQFLAALAKSGNVARAAIDAHLDGVGLEEARRMDRSFAREWEAAEKASGHKLEHEAWRRAVDGVPEPLISDGKVVRDDDGRPLSIQRYSDALLIEMLRIYRPRKYAGSSFWKSALASRRTRRLAFVTLIVVIALVAGNLAVQWFANHLLIAAFH